MVMAPQTFQLVMKVGPTPGKVIPLTKDELTIGRDVSNDIVINDAEISRKHARLYLGPAGYNLEDQGSTNGSFVNDQRLVGPHALRHGETIRFGEHVELSYESTAPDLNATMVGGPVPMAYTPASVPEPVPAFQETPVFSGQVPPGPVEQPVVPAPQEKKTSTTWLLAGCGCLLVVCCLLAAGSILFDYLNLYCTPPFNLIFGLVVACP
jgi:predicted component of type VI protein secretion system